MRDAGADQRLDAVIRDLEAALSLAASTTSAARSGAHDRRRA
jgi:hypothetical protein